jgi:predicted metal-binding protein
MPREVILQTSDLEKYCEKALQEGATHAKIINPSTVVTAPWVRFKCLFGCSYKHRYSCPPHTPTPEETQATLNSYSRAILFHREAPYTRERGKEGVAYLDNLVKLEGALFRDGYYKAFVMLAGPCTLCKECGKVEGVPCRLPAKTRPAMEACGIDVFQTARNNDFFITTLKEKSETQNLYCLMLVD